MQSSPMLLLAAILASMAVADSTNAWTIPANQAPGVYAVSTAPDGSKTHTLVSDHSKTARSISRVEVSKRDNTGIECGSYNLPETDVSIASQALAHQCGPAAPVHSGMDYYSIYGEAVAYYCNFSDGSTMCTAGDAFAAYGSIQSVCGAEAGWNKFPHQRYGYEATGSEFCGRGV